MRAYSYLIICEGNTLRVLLTYAFIFLYLSYLGIHAIFLVFKNYVKALHSFPFLIHHYPNILHNISLLCIIYQQALLTIYHLIPLFKTLFGIVH
jgi:hypothetical protein